MSTPNYGFDVRWSERDEAFVATCPSFPGLSAVGNTRDEALAEAEEVLMLYVEEYEEDGIELPAVVEAEAYSGQFRLRLPLSLHAALARLAEREGVSLNSLVVMHLSQAAGQARAADALGDRICVSLDRIEGAVASLQDVTSQVAGGFVAVSDQLAQVAAYRAGHAGNVDEDGGFQDPVLRRLTSSADATNY